MENKKRKISGLILAGTTLAGTAGTAANTASASISSFLGSLKTTAVNSAIDKALGKAVGKIFEHPIAFAAIGVVVIVGLPVCCYVFVRKHYEEKVREILNAPSEEIQENNNEKQKANVELFIRECSLSGLKRLAKISEDDNAKKFFVDACCRDDTTRKFFINLLGKANKKFSLDNLSAFLQNCGEYKKKGYEGKFYRGLKT